MSVSFSKSMKRLLLFGVVLCCLLVWGNPRAAAVDEVAWTVSGNDILNPNTTGKVGIGTTSPSALLTVGSSATQGIVDVVATSGTAPYVRFINNLSGGNNWRVGPSLTEAAGSFSIYNQTADSFPFNILNGGNVGIGTTAPGYKLDVDGTLRSRVSSGWSNLFLSKASGASISFDNDAGVETAMIESGTPANSNRLEFWTNTSSNSGVVERMRIDNAGNVGIGTTAPGYTLDVNGTLHSKVTSGSNLFLSKASGASISFNNDAGVETAMIESGTPANSNRLEFWTNTSSNSGSVERMRIDNAGNVGIGTTNPSSKLEVNGNVTVSGNIAAKYQDIAEWVFAKKPIPVGSVVILDPERANAVVPSSESYDTRVAGVVSGTPGILLGERGENKVKVATTGRVRVHVDATTAPIHIGDLLVTSDKQGIAMRSQAIEVAGRKIHQPGTLIGKALETLDRGEGEILVLLSLQ